MMMVTASKMCAVHPKALLPCRQCEINQAEHGEDKGVVTFVYLSNRDDWGRYHFCIWWWAENFHSGPSWRGQHFFADPAPYMEKDRAAGLKVRELDKRS